MTVAALVLVPAVGGVLILALGGRSRAAGPAALAALTATLTLGAIAAVTEPQASWSWGPRLDAAVAVGGFTRAMVVLVPAIAFAVTAWTTAVGDPSLHRLVGTITVFVGAMELLVIAADLLTLLVAWELVAACSWLLIAHDWRDSAKPASARAAYLTTRVGDLGLYVAVGAALAATGSLRFTSLHAASRPELDVIAAGVLLAAAAKSAQVPFSPWLFSAMAGPTPASALLHSATMVAAGAYTLIRLGPAFFVLPWFQPVVIAIGLTSALAGGVVASLHTDLKRALAGSTTAQFGLMFLAIGAGATGAAALHLVAHALFKALLFLGAGTAIHLGGTGDLRRLRLGRRVPVVAMAFGVGAAALAAVPPLGGAFSKDAVVAAAFERSAWLGLLAMLAGLTSAFYAARLAVLAYGPGSAAGTDRVAWLEVVPLAGLAGASVALGALWLPGGTGLARRLTGEAIPGGASLELVLSAVLVIVGVTAVWLLDRSGRLVTAGLPRAAQRLATGWFGLPTLAGEVVVGPVLAVGRALDRFDASVADRIVIAPARGAAELSRLVRRFDDRVVDAGVRATAGAAATFSRLLDAIGEFRVDGIVRATAGATMGIARASRAGDEVAVDGAVEGLAAGVAAAGTWTRKLQNGAAHRYYLIVAVGSVALVAAAALWR